MAMNSLLKGNFSKHIGRKINLEARKNFWTVSKGRIVGYVEQMGTVGIMFTHKYIHLRPTTSNLSNHGQILSISLSKFAEEKEPILREAMNKRLPVTVEYTEDLIGSPRVGFVLEAFYLKEASIDHKIVDAIVQPAASQS